MKNECVGGYDLMQIIYNKFLAWGSVKKQKMHYNQLSEENVVTPFNFICILIYMNKSKSWHANKYDPT